MRNLAIAALGLVLCVPSAAFADVPTLTELESKGEQLAKEGRFSEAIATFKAADRITPRASHACLIALAYLRREAWPQAEVFLATCHQRVTETDPLPDWVDIAEQTLAERLATAGVAPVAIRVEPATAVASLTVSSFAPDETFAPRTIHLAVGHHIISATAPGFIAAQEPVDVTDNAAKQVVIVLHPIGSVTPPTPPVVRPLPPARLEHSSSNVPWIVAGAGGAVTVAGALVHLFVYKPVHDDLAKASADHDLVAYDALSSSFDQRRTLTVALYGVGIATAITGMVLHYTVFRDRESPQVGIQPTTGGATIGVSWHR